MINLDDFSVFFSNKENAKIEENEKENTKNNREEIEVLRLQYQNELIKLQKKYEEELERIKKEYYNYGLMDGAKKKEEELEKKFSQEIEKIIQSKELEVKKLKEHLIENIKKIKEENQENILKFFNSILDSIEEILEYLYISNENLPFLEKKIKEILDLFQEEVFLNLEVGKGLYDYLANTELNVKLNPNLGKFDFKLNFNEFEIESRFIEKLKVLRDELEKEIKESS